MKIHRIIARITVVCAVAVLVAILAVRLYCHWSIASVFDETTLHAGFQTVENRRFIPHTLDITDKQAMDRLSGILLSRKHRIGLAPDVPVDADEYAFLGDPRHDSSWSFIYGNFAEIKTGSGISFRLTYSKEVIEPVKAILAEAPAK